MKSNEFWSGYHSARKGQRIEDCPFRFEPNSAKEWKRGFNSYLSEAKAQGKTK